MRILRNLLNNFNLLNIVLITGIILMLYYLLFPALKTEIKFTLPAAKESHVEAIKPPSAVASPSLIDYAVIAENNLFHPQRRIPAEKTAAEALPKPEFVLYGIMSGPPAVVFIEDLRAPISTTGRGKRQRRLQVGDTMSGYTLVEIGKDKIVMARDDDRIEVKATDLKQSKTRVVEVAPSAPAQPRQANGQTPPQIIKRRPARPQPSVPSPPQPDMPILDEQPILDE